MNIQHSIQNTGCFNKKTEDLPRDIIKKMSRLCLYEDFVCPKTGSMINTNMRCEIISLDDLVVFDVLSHNSPIIRNVCCYGEKRELCLKYIQHLIDNRYCSDGHITIPEEGEFICSVYLPGAARSLKQLDIAEELAACFWHVLRKKLDMNNDRPNRSMKPYI